MYRIKTFNKISPVGLNRLDPALYSVSDSVTDEDAILVRSAKLLDYDFPKDLLAIARAGAGVNNIPLDRCAEQGIVVFNTPGANANAVKELVLPGCGRGHPVGAAAGGRRRGCDHRGGKGQGGLYRAGAV